MNLAESRFASLVGPHCPAPRCEVPVISCLTTGAAILVDAEPSAEGTHKLGDTGAVSPYASITVPSGRFGLQGRLHRRHTSYCMEYQKSRKRG